MEGKVELSRPVKLEVCVEIELPRRRIGSAGNTTTALLLATELAAKGARVTIIDRRSRALDFGMGKAPQ